MPVADAGRSADEDVPDQRRAVLRRFLDRIRRRSVLTDREADAILALPAQRTLVDAHRDFVTMGERVTHACLIADGLVARFGQIATGERQIVGLHIPGDMADLHSVVSPHVSTPLSALAPCEIWQVPHEVLRGVARDHPAIAHAFWRDGIVDANIVSQAALNLGRRPAKARLAHLLCEMAVRYGDIGVVDKGCFAFPITQPQLGDALGLTGVHVNRMVRLLREGRLVDVFGGRVRINDWQGLVDVADFDPSYLQRETVDFHLQRAGMPGITP